jgi:opacity protein-like surface antigen
MMKKSCGWMVVGSAMSLAAAHAQAQCTNLYVDVSAGPAIQQDISVHNSSFGNGGTVNFNDGVRASVKIGYDLTPSFAAELETGIIWNGINSIHGNTLSDFGANANIYEIPLLANFIYKPLHGAFEPYVGVGCGGVAGIFDESSTPLIGSSFNDSDFVFAYQAEVGFKYAVSQNVELGLAYQFLGTTDHHWSDNGVFLNTAGTMTHAITATFTWRF